MSVQRALLSVGHVITGLALEAGVQEAGRGTQTPALIHELQTSCSFQSWSVGDHWDICTERRWASKGETTDNGWQLSSVPMGQSSDPLSGTPKPPACIASHHIWLNGHAMRCTHIPYIYGNSIIFRNKT